MLLNIVEDLRHGLSALRICADRDHHRRRAGAVEPPCTRQQQCTLLQGDFLLEKGLDLLKNAGLNVWTSPIEGAEP